jgi:hypothetical protein
VKGSQLPALAASLDCLASSSALQVGRRARQWYSSGTQVFRYAIDLSRHPAQVRFYDRQAYVPAGASTWTSRVYREMSGPGGNRTLYFFATDISRGFDFFKLALP